MMSRTIVLAIAACTFSSPMVTAWVPQMRPLQQLTSVRSTNTRSRTARFAIDTKKDKKVENEKEQDTTAKFGLEAGLFVVKQKTAANPPGL
jgi:hypothetical protein